jgi:hypothetical protein
MYKCVKGGADAAGTRTTLGEPLTYSDLFLTGALLIAPHAADVLTEQTGMRASLDHLNKNISATSSISSVIQPEV